MACGQRWDILFVTLATKIRYNTCMEMLELIKEAQKGNNSAFSQIYDSYADLLFRFIKTKVQNQQEAEDLLQEAFIKAWRALSRLKADQSLKLKPWLYTIAHNCVNDHFRKIYRRPENLELDENLNISSGRSPAEELVISSDIETLKKVMEGLPPQYKEILELRYIQDIDPKACAEILKKIPSAYAFCNTEH